VKPSLSNISWGQLLGLDGTPKPLQCPGKIKSFDGSVILVNKNFTHLEEVCKEYNFHPINGILFDLDFLLSNLTGGTRILVSVLMDLLI